MSSSPSRTICSHSCLPRFVHFLARCTRAHDIKIECALRHWTSGVFVDEPFTTSVYDGIYDKHLTSIEAIAAKDPAYLQEMKDEIWASAWYVYRSPGAPSD